MRQITIRSNDAPVHRRLCASHGISDILGKRTVMFHAIVGTASHSVRFLYINNTDTATLKCGYQLFDLEGSNILHLIGPA